MQVRKLIRLLAENPGLKVLVKDKSDDSDYPYLEVSDVSVEDVLVNGDVITLANGAEPGPNQTRIKAVVIVPL